MEHARAQVIPQVIHEVAPREHNGFRALVAEITSRHGYSFIPIIPIDSHKPACPLLIARQTGIRLLPGCRQPVKLNENNRPECQGCALLSEFAIAVSGNGQRELTYRI